MSRKVSNIQILNQTKVDLNIALKCAVPSAFLTRFKWVFLLKNVCMLFLSSVRISSQYLC